MRLACTAVCVAAIVMLVGIGYAASHVNVHQLPTCPQEDSCAVDYRDGRWFIDGVVVSR